MQKPTTPKYAYVVVARFRQDDVPLYVGRTPGEAQRMAIGLAATPAEVVETSRQAAGVEVGRLLAVEVMQVPAHYSAVGEVKTLESVRTGE